MLSLIERATQTTRLWMSVAELAADSQSVVAMRLMGLGGVWHVPRSEATDMVSEKMPAFTEAYLSGMFSAMAGQAPEEIGQATLDPLSQTTRNNRQRLAKYGPRLPLGRRFDPDLQ